MGLKDNHNYLKMSRFIVFILFAIITNIARSQDVPLTSNGDLRFYVDFTAFQGKEGKTYQEFYLMLYADELNEIMKSGEKSCVFDVTSEINQKDNDDLISNSWQTEAKITQDSLDLRSLAIYDQWGHYLHPGLYRLHVSVKDANGSRNGEVNEWINIISFNSNNILSSQIEFVSDARSTNEKSRFDKANKIVIPNPTRRYGVLNPTLYFYYELYNLPELDTRNLITTYSIIDREDKIIKTYPPKTIIPRGENISILHGLSVLQVPSGIYYLSANISDSAEEIEVTIIRQFEIIQTDYFQIQPLLTSEQADKASRLLKYIASPSEYNSYQKLSSSGKAQFLIRFWRDRDPSPGTLENELLDAVKQRYHYSNDNFSWGSVDGWATDRGRVLIQYGMPEEIERFYFEDESHPYEIWIYSRQRLYEFIFADFQSNGNFVLLHSTMEGEIHNKQWKTLIRRL